MCSSKNRMIVTFKCGKQRNNISSNNELVALSALVLFLAIVLMATEYLVTISVASLVLSLCFSTFQRSNFMRSLGTIFKFLWPLFFVCAIAFSVTRISTSANRSVFLLPPSTMSDSPATKSTLTSLNASLQRNDQHHCHYDHDYDGYYYYLSTTTHSSAAACVLRKVQYLEAQEGEETADSPFFLEGNALVVDASASDPSVLDAALLRLIGMGSDPLASVVRPPLDLPGICFNVARGAARMWWFVFGSASDNDKDSIGPTPFVLIVRIAVDEPDRQPLRRDLFEPTRFRLRFFYDAEVVVTFPRQNTTESASVPTHNEGVDQEEQQVEILAKNGSVESEQEIPTTQPVDDVKVPVSTTMQLHPNNHKHGCIAERSYYDSTSPSANTAGLSQQRHSFIGTNSSTGGHQVTPLTGVDGGNDDKEESALMDVMAAVGVAWAGLYAIFTPYNPCLLVAIL